MGSSTSKLAWLMAAVPQTPRLFASSNACFTATGSWVAPSGNGFVRLARPAGLHDADHVFGADEVFGWCCVHHYVYHLQYEIRHQKSVVGITKTMTAYAKRCDRRRKVAKANLSDVSILQSTSMPWRLSLPTQERLDWSCAIVFFLLEYGSNGAFDSLAAHRDAQTWRPLLLLLHCANCVPPRRRLAQALD